MLESICNIIEAVWNWSSSFQRADYFSFSGAMVAFSSLCVSYVNFRRDRGHLDVKIGLWHSHDIATGARTGSFIRITAVNSGRRPIVADSVGGFPRWQSIKRFLNRRFPDSFKPVGFFIVEQKVIDELVDRSTGRYKTVKEGDSIQISLPITGPIPSDNAFSKMHKFYVGDSTGREYYAPDHILKKFKKDLKSHA